MRSAPAFASSTRRAEAHAEVGFTMIEMLVAMVLLAVALAVASGGILQSISGGSSARSGAASDAAIARASARFADDVANTTTEDLRDGKLRDPVEFRAAVQRNEQATSSDPSSPGTRLDLDSVLMATSREVHLRTEANVANGFECVTWRATTSSGYRLERLVDPGSGCGSGSLARETMVSAPSGIAGIDTTPFSFDLICNGCPGGASSCRSFSRSDVPADQRRWIVGMHLTVDSVTVGRDPSQASGSTGSEIRGRDTESYRRALGC